MKPLVRRHAILTARLLCLRRPAFKSAEYRNSAVGLAKVVEQICEPVRFHVLEDHELDVWPAKLPARYLPIIMICHIVTNLQLRQLQTIISSAGKFMTDFQENQIAEEGVRLIRGKLPDDWSLDRLERLGPESRADFSVRLKAPDGQESCLLIEVKTRFNSYSLGSAFSGPQKDLGLLVAPFFTPSSRRRLRDAGVNFADLTGNVRLSVARPSLFLETSGASVDPAPAQVKRSLKGSKAARIIRALIDNRPPLRLTDLARLTGVDIGYTSRVLAQLSSEGLLSRNRRGPVTAINWEELIRRWADDYKVAKSNAASYFLEPRGLPRLLEQLRQTSLRYALTGSQVAAMRAPVAAARLAMLYVEDSRAAGSVLDLRPAEVGGNVILLVPRDPLPFEGTSRESDLVLAAPSQVAVDLLTGPGRSASEAEAFLEWMKADEDVWRR